MDTQTIPGCSAAASPTTSRTLGARQSSTGPRSLTSAARSADNPWRLRVAVDLLGVGCTNSIRCVAPKDESDHDLLYALLAILGSGFTSAYAAQYGIDRNIPAPVMQSFPVPTSRSAIDRLAKLGREASRAALDTSTLGGVLHRIEESCLAGIRP